MKKPLPNDLLKLKVKLLEAKRDRELIDLKEHFHAVKASLNPINLIKDSFKSATASPDLADGIDKTVIGLLSGFLVKNLVYRNSFNPLKIAASIGLQIIGASVASKNSDKIKSTGLKLFHSLLSKIKHHKNGVHKSEIQSYLD